jgi:hypothetical protein
MRCVALAHALGHALADIKAMPRDEALARMDALRAIVQVAYGMKDVQTER